MHWTPRLGILERDNPPMFRDGGLVMSQPDQPNGQVQPDFESRLRLGLSEVLHERPELREVLPLAALMDDALRWCA
jgi:hypothetical protein